ncbi:MAG: 4Fe-4S binding protein [Nitrososphaerota archaeon]|jgi:pyruvate ferredoxin oxidoreductase gamma subunit|nr:4Fe-4S binding protein [Nitrososphaerota archaeon]MDG6916816.1 4Fe-4S binding protein [Nitrososphaerota archaeon]
MDDSLVADQSASPFAGLRKGGLAIVNTTRPAAEVNGGRDDVTVLTLDLTRQALDVLGKAVLSASIAAAVARSAGISAEAFVDGLVGELKEAGLSDDLTSKNVTMAEAVYDELKPVKLRTEELPAKAELVPFTAVVSGDGSEDIVNTGNSASRHTGNWRITRPVIDYLRCTDCMACYAYCPESAMSVRADGRVTIDYDNCKGCMICQTECPPRAIGSRTED